MATADEMRRNFGNTEVIKDVSGHGITSSPDYPYIFIADNKKSAINVCAHDGTIKKIIPLPPFEATTDHGHLSMRGTKIIFADYRSHVIREICPITDTIRIFGEQSMNHVHQPWGIAVHPITNVIYFGEFRNHTIRSIDMDGNLETIAGGRNGYKNGHCSEALFSYPRGLTCTSTHLYISEEGNKCIRVLDFSTMHVSLFSGHGGHYYEASLTNTYYGAVVDIVRGRNGIFYVTDRDNNRIRMIDTVADIVQTLHCFNGKDYNICKPNSLWISADGYLWCGQSDCKILKIDIRYQELCTPVTTKEWVEATQRSASTVRMESFCTSINTILPGRGTVLQDLVHGLLSCNDTSTGGELYTPPLANVHPVPFTQIPFTSLKKLQEQIRSAPPSSVLSRVGDEVLIIPCHGYKDVADTIESCVAAIPHIIELLNDTAVHFRDLVRDHEDEKIARISNIAHSMKDPLEWKTHDVRAREQASMDLLYWYTEIIPETFFGKEITTLINIGQTVRAAIAAYRVQWHSFIEEHTTKAQDALCRVEDLQILQETSPQEAATARSTYEEHVQTIVTHNLQQALDTVAIDGVTALKKCMHDLQLYESKVILLEKKASDVRSHSENWITSWTALADAHHAILKQCSRSQEMCESLYLWFCKLYGKCFDLLFEKRSQRAQIAYSIPFKSDVLHRRLLHCTRIHRQSIELLLPEFKKRLAQAELDHQIALKTTFDSNDSTVELKQIVLKQIRDTYLQLEKEYCDCMLMSIQLENWDLPPVNHQIFLLQRRAAVTVIVKTETQRQTVLHSLYELPMHDAHVKDMNILKRSMEARINSKGLPEEQNKIIEDFESNVPLCTMTQAIYFQEATLYKGDFLYGQSKENIQTNDLPFPITILRIIGTDDEDKKSTEDFTSWLDDFFPLKEQFTGCTSSNNENEKFTHGPDKEESCIQDAENSNCHGNDSNANNDSKTHGDDNENNDSHESYDSCNDIVVCDNVENASSNDSQQQSSEEYDRYTEGSIGSFQLVGRDH